MSRILALVLALVSCFDPQGGRPAGDVSSSSSTSAVASTTTVVVPDPSTTSGQVPTSAADTTTTTSGSTSGDTTSQLLDMPGETCPIWSEFAWGPCGDAGACDAGHDCWLASSGWLCLPECREDAECADACSPSGDTRCDAGVCRPMCTISQDCALGYTCDGGTCVLPSDCGPGSGKDAWHPCDAMGLCAQGTCVTEIDAGSVCAPSCETCSMDEDALVCGVVLGVSTCGPVDLCRIECTSDTNCVPGMQCAVSAGTCVWP